jgi:hypothetical protein
MHISTAFALPVYSINDSISGDAQSPLDLMSPMHLMMVATVRIDSDVEASTSYSSWVFFSGKVTQNVNRETHVFPFL